MDTLLQVLLTILIFGLLVAIYIGTYLLNKSVKKPDDALEVLSECEACNITSCGHNTGRED